MSSSNLQVYEEESEGSVLVDWGAAGSTKSVPARASKAGVDPGRNAISLYDSDSSDEMRRSHPPKRSSLLSTIRHTMTDDDPSVEDCMILSDDNDDSEEEEDILSRVQTSLSAGVSLEPTPLPPIVPPKTPAPSADPMPPAIANSSSILSAGSNVSNVTGSGQKGALPALFVDDKSWREMTPWKRRAGGARHGRFRSLDQKSDDKFEDGGEEGGRRIMRGNIFRNISLGSSSSTPTAAAQQQQQDGDHQQPTNPSQREQNAMDQLSDEDDEDFEEEVSVHSSQLSELDLDGQLDWEKLPPLPNSFLGSGKLHPSMSQYLDIQHTHMVKSIADQFTLEHSLLLRAILQLLDEREVRGIAQVDLKDSVVLKQGSLKKFSHSVGRPTWKVKYAEVRRGSFCYYEDTANESKSARKTIPLAGCICQGAENKVGRYVFELLSENSPRRLFMCSSEEERQSWMRVIEDAKQEKKRPLNLAQYQWSIDTYKAMQMNLQHSLSKGEYMLQLGDLEKLKMELPIQWVLEQADETNQMPRRVRTRTIDFWKFLDKQNFVINGHAIPCESLHSPERTMGALTRCIMEYDHTTQEEQTHHNLTEVQGVSYARNVLVAVWHSRARDDSHYALDNMCQNGGLVIVLPMSEDPKIFVNVGYSTTHDMNVMPPDHEVSHQVSGWVTSRSKKFKNWKNRYCVISEGVLSYYEHANPRPHGLRGQVVLVGASVNVIAEKAREDMHLHILELVSKDQDRERQLAFRDEASFSKWREAIQHAINSCTPEFDPTSPSQSPERRRRAKRVIPTGRLMKKGMENGNRMMQGAAAGGFKVIKGASDLFDKITRQKNDERMASMSTDLESGYDAASFEPPSVEINVDSCRHYKIMTSDPTGDDNEDTWVTVRSTTSQTFKLSGGTNGLLIVGEELVELDFYKGVVTEEDTADDTWKLEV
jgi:hypothetical protein